MKFLLAALALSTLVAVPAFALEPIPGSITYGGASYGRLTKSPVGSTVFHQFSHGGNNVNETYVVGPDHILDLVTRSIADSH